LNICVTTLTHLLHLYFNVKPIQLQATFVYILSTLLNIETNFAQILLFRELNILNLIFRRIWFGSKFNGSFTCPKCNRQILIIQLCADLRFKFQLKWRFNILYAPPFGSA